MSHSKIEKAVKKIFQFAGLQVKTYDRILPEPWSTSVFFQHVLKEIEARTVVAEDRCFMLYQMAKYADGKDGDMAEVGVYKGGTAKIISKTCPKKKIHVFDTFAGMPDVISGIDVHSKGDFLNTSIEAVKNFLSDCSNIVFHPGFFPDTAESVKDKKFCFVYIDVDIYQSVKSCMEFFYPRMVSGGVMVFDDYEWRGCPGVKKAIDEFLADKKEVPIITTKYQCMLLKE